VPDQAPRTPPTHLPRHVRGARAAARSARRDPVDRSVSYRVREDGLSVESAVPCGFHSCACWAAARRSIPPCFPQVQGHDIARSLARRPQRVGSAGDMKGGSIPAAAAIMPSPLFLWRFKVLHPLSVSVLYC
jgi:hypothetical protein